MNGSPSVIAIPQFPSTSTRDEPYANLEGRSRMPAAVAACRHSKQVIGPGRGGGYPIPAGELIANHVSGTRALCQVLKEGGAT